MKALILSKYTRYIVASAMIGSFALRYIFELKELDKLITILQIISLLMFIITRISQVLVDKNPLQGS
jgi:hypothetical protein